MLEYIFHEVSYHLDILNAVNGNNIRSCSTSQCKPFLNIFCAPFLGVFVENFMAALCII
jgi:hypothetical protein